MRALLLAALVATPAAAAEEQQTWIRGTVVKSLGRLDLTLETQARTADGFATGRLFFARPTVDYRLSDRLSVGGGAFIGFYPQTDGSDRGEKRLFQQLQWFGPVGRTRIAARTRLEQRRFEDGRDTGWRLRQQLRVSHPLGAGGKAVRGLAYAEGFVHLNSTDWGAKRGFDQGRAFVGAEVPLAGRSTIEAGYLNQTVNGRRGARSTAHVAALALTLRL